MKQYKFSRAFLWFTKITGLPLLLYLHFKVYFEGDNKKLRRPAKPCILMSNHTALIDYALYLALFYFRSLRFLMAEVLFDNRPLLNWFLLKMGGIRVDRNAYDFSFVGDALEILDRGGTVGVFPEGRLPRGEKDLPFKPGIVYIALRTDAPIVPIYTDGNYGFFKRARVIIGEEIHLRQYCNTDNPSEDDINHLTQLLKSRIDSLRDELERKKQ
ncbi:MAG: 1-acyl-sn-glycerol-3-phosphate acyltransferase [Clostridia bacterium]|nr:1-acyl-sn-glycerol-3-phosphate acyltransferase [Clostridia bacterium]